VPAAPSTEPTAARLVAARRLNRDGSQKDTRHIVIADEAGALGYAVGDSLGVVARNCPELVQAAIERLGVRPDTPVMSPDGIERPLAEALSNHCEIRRPSDQAIEVLSSRAHDIDESRLLQAMAEGYPGAGPEDPDLLDLLEYFRSARPPLSELISALHPLQPRLYSIASSPKIAAGQVHLTVEPVRYEKRARRRGGVASTFLCDRLAAGEAVAVFVRPSEAFRLAPPDRPMIMIGPGTGIAPFRAFLQERRATGARGRNWLFCGNPHRQTDFLYEDELLEYSRDGLLARLDTAFSRDQEHKVYVQHECSKTPPSCGPGSKTVRISTSAATPSGWPAMSIAGWPTSSPSRAGWGRPPPNPTSCTSPARAATSGMSIEPIGGRAPPPP
jgi:sulfite reductase (NADPH) flavoprotein alpha-component